MVPRKAVPPFLQGSVAGGFWEWPEQRAQRSVPAELLTRGCKMFVKHRETKAAGVTSWRGGFLRRGKNKRGLLSLAFWFLGLMSVVVLGFDHGGEPRHFAANWESTLFEEKRFYF